MKPDKYGIKVYLNYESKTGYLLKLQICAGSKPINETVMTSMDKYTEKKHILYMDNYYNSVKLTEMLLNKKIYVCKTLRTNRGSSKEFEEKFLKLKKDQICYEITEKCYIIGVYF
ncbi:hypothetical protein CDIK_4159, partial [Cucumispora dikerogammari]